jgi:chromatin segregation and condensation protein Rec8/ScpA/Scc1 (kleisin family)
VACLELVKQRRIRAVQEKPFAPIRIELTEEAAPGEGAAEGTSD